MGLFYSLNKENTIMLLTKFNASNISKLLDDLDRLYIGSDYWFNNLNSSYITNSNYPPYNVVDLGDKKRVEVALAGFSKEEISVYTERNLLTVEVNKKSKEEEKYHYNGIARRNFKRSWTLGDDVRVEDIKFSDGLLTIYLTTIVPDHQKKKIYEIR